MKSKIEEFVFKLWTKDASEEKMSEKEYDILYRWKSLSKQDIDRKHMQESQKEVYSMIEPYFRKEKNLFRKYAYQAAAVVILLLSLGGLFTYNAVFIPDVYFAKSENVKVILKDGSVITLLKGAELTVKKSFPEDTRIVELKGDAIFSVAKDKSRPFVVRAGNFSTRVLGTVFKISQSGKEKSVELYQGKVAVSYDGIDDTYLNPNQTWTNFGLNGTSAIYTKSQEDKSTKQIKNIELLVFKDAPFGEVIEVLKKHYSITILYPSEIRTEKISAKLGEGTIDENIEMLAFAVGMEVQKENSSTYTLKK